MFLQLKCFSGCRNFRGVAYLLNAMDGQLFSGNSEDRLYAREFPNYVSLVGSLVTRIIARLKWRRRIRLSWVLHRTVCEARVSIRAIRFRNFSSAWFSDLSEEAGLLFACAERIARGKWYRRNAQATL